MEGRRKEHNKGITKGEKSEISKGEKTGFTTGGRKPTDPPPEVTEVTNSLVTSDLQRIMVAPRG